MNMIKRSAVRAFAMEVSQLARAGKFTRVSRDFLDVVDRRLAEIVESMVKSHPSKGKTLKP